MATDGVMGLLMFIGAVLGALAFFQIRKLKVEVALIKQQLATKSSQSVLNQAENTAPLATAEPLKMVEQPVDIKPEPKASTAIAATTTSSINAPVSQPKPSQFDILFSRFKENWMVWLGGLCVALAGIFLARYSIQQGFFGPVARISTGILVGFGLHSGAEWLRHKNNGSVSSIAALAGGGSITLFATLLAALHFYQMFNPTTIFILLGLVSCITMWLARLHGPVLAAIGMLGAYVVPILVSDGGGHIEVAMLYSLVISASVLFLLRYVYRDWLWYGLIAGGLGWWGISLLDSDMNGWRGAYLALFGYGLIAIMWRDWLLRQVLEIPENSSLFNVRHVLEDSRERILPITLALVCGAQCISILAEGFASLSLLSWLPLMVILLLAAQRRQTLTALPWLLFLGQIVIWLLSRVSETSEKFILIPMPEDQQGAFVGYLLITALVVSVLSIWNRANSAANEHFNRDAWWASLAVMAPLFSFVLAYLLCGSLLQDWLWSLTAAIIAATYIALATYSVRGEWPQVWSVWLFLAGHFGYAFAASLLFDEAGLTLAIAVQSISIAVIMQRFNLADMSWLLKVVLVLVVARLTLNPWVAEYPIDTHWSLWTYGGSTLCAWISLLVLRQWQRRLELTHVRDLMRWAEAAVLHLFVLTLWVELRYWLYDGDIFAAEFTLLEAALNVGLFGTLALVYQHKCRVSQSLAKLYNIYSHGLMTAAFLTYGVILIATLNSHDWVWAAISTTPILNALLLVFAVPALLGYLSVYYFVPEYRKGAAVFTAIAGFIFVSLEIRHLWQGSINLELSTSNGELYTYSAVWLAIAVAAILSGSGRFGITIYRGGMLMLGLVIAKVFLVDMSQLAGIYRVIAFMGLGLSLLGMAFLHQRQKKSVEQDE
ncbi:MAG: DUF2339 domain-containing protein [Thalassolituus oleivorans]|nr:DUF2339 domain-containing protein [Thalassolituus oleivorans]